MTGSYYNKKNIYFLARNPPPICFGQDIVEQLDVEVCLRIYDINITNDKFHACFQVLGKIMKLPITKIQLGCIQTKLREKIEYVENNLSSFITKTKKNILPSTSYSMSSSVSSSISFFVSNMIMMCSISFFVSNVIMM